MRQKNLRIVFAGTPEISAHVLESLIAKDHKIVGVFTQPDRARGRGRKSLPSPVKAIAEQHKLAVYQPVSFKKEPAYIAALKALNADVMIVLAYGLILPEAVLNTPKHGCINIHVSLLPRWRGAAPIQRAIEAGDQKTGVTIMQMDRGLDTGNILYQLETPILAEDTAASMHDKLAVLSIPALDKVLEDMRNDSLTPVQQDERFANCAAKLKKQEGQINWQQSAAEIERKVRAFFPWPGSYFYLDDTIIKVADVRASNEKAKAKAGQILDITQAGLKVQTADGIIVITKLQFPGKKMLGVDSILNGRNLTSYIGVTLAS